MKLYVMRHGETITNQIHLISGNNETDLTENGIKQAKQARKYLENIEFDYVFTSPLSRARITASHITNKSIIIDKRLIERDYGSFDLKRKCDVDYDGFWNYHTNLINDGENIKDILKRVENLITDLKNKYPDKEQEIIRLYHEKVTEKEQIELRLNSLEKEITRKKERLENTQADVKLKNQRLRNLEKESRELEITINRNDVKLDTMLETLSVDYEITYERAKKEYPLDIEPDEARSKVNNYKANIKRIGMVNIDAIEEYEKVSSRYIFLTNQKEDLLNAEDTLLDIMKEMDEVMKEEFKNTFQEIRNEFQNVFKCLFNGGSADLKLTNPEDLLTTGIDIVASPPGKKLSSISLLSGGEKTLTAISLLFAILNVRTVPFCLFDEVEAALDEANVNQFGRYLNDYKNKTQFLIITHKKKTMEYANTLYGITMQESGVSKLVSVKLEDREEILN